MQSAKRSILMFIKRGPIARRFGAFCGLSLCVLPLCLVPQTARAQQNGLNSKTVPATPPAGIPLPSASTPAAGGLLMELGRELNALILQSRDGVVSIKGHRALTVQEALLGGPNNGMGRTFAPPLPPASPAPDRPVYVPVIGSGFLVQGDLVVTTYEVAENIINPVVLLADGRTTLRVLAKSLDRENNVAIFKVARQQGSEALQFLRLGDSESILPGSVAVTIGNQAGFANSSGFAFIAKTGRRARSGSHFYASLIQFQGAVGPGSSGSPLIGATGDVVGMVIATPDTTQSGYWRGGEGNNSGGGRDGGRRRSPEGEIGDKPGHGPTLKAHKSQMGSGGESQTFGHGGGRDTNARDKADPDAMLRQMGPGMGIFGGLSSMGFALPVNAFRDRLDALAQNMQPVSAPGWVGLHAEDGPLSGAYITNLYDGSPADKGGLEIGDIITQVEGRPIRSGRDFFISLVSATEGQTLRLQVQRRGATRILPIRLSAKPDAEALRRMSQRVAPGVGLHFVFGRHNA